MAETTTLIDCPHCGIRVEATLLRDWLDYQYEYRLLLPAFTS
jgi:hypothetical protein